MFFDAAKTLAGMVTEEEYAMGRIYPRLGRIREVSVAIGVAVAEVAFRRGLTEMNRPDDLMRHEKAKRYDPAYVEYIPRSCGIFTRRTSPWADETIRRGISI
jgi:malate dehydrogenase (oxaloacetate-decarboxylating)(NADP+)